MDQTLVEAVIDHARHIPNKYAVILKKNKVTYFELEKLMKNAASILNEEYGIGEGDKVMITGLSKPEYIIVFLGIQYLHAVTLPIDKIWHEETILKLYDFVTPKIIITDTAIKRKNVKAVSLKELYKEIVEIDDREPEYTLPDLGNVAEMLFTTGTTGSPKGAMLTYGNVLSITNNNINAVGIKADDVILNALPLCHSLGLREARAALYSGATLVLQNGFSFPRELRNNIEEFGCTGFVCVPATMEQLTRIVSGFEELFGHFRFMEIGAGSLSYDLKKRLPKMLPHTEIYNAWGSSETGGAIFLDVKGRQDKITALGKPISGVLVKAVGPDGSEIRATSIDNAGRLAVKGDMTMVGYYNMPELNQVTIVDGWLYTNDLVYMDDEGFVYMLGRADDIINVGGEKVSPIEIENAATEFDKVYDAACIGVHDDIMGQVPVLFVSVVEPYKESELTHFLAGRLESFKIPQKIIRIEEIPRNRMKKLDRKAVRKLWDERLNKKEYNNDLIQLILSRHSVRSFTDKKIDHDMLELLVKTGIQAPSGHNLQTWKFTVVTNDDMIAEIKNTGSAVAKREGTPFYGFNNPAALLIVSYDNRNDTGALDTACATENILLSAHSLGLGACWFNGLMRIWEQPEIVDLQEKMHIPKNHRICSVIMLGYPASEDKAPVRKENVVEWIK